MSLPRHAYDAYDKHLFLAVVAVVFSLAVHLACIFAMADMRLGGMTIRDRLNLVKPERPPMRVQTSDARAFERAAELPVTEPERERPLDERVEHVGSGVALTTPPPPPPREALAPTVPEATVATPVDTWQPRQEIQQIIDRRVQAEAGLPRRELPAVTRVTTAPDIVPAATPRMLSPTVPTVSIPDAAPAPLSAPPQPFVPLTTEDTLARINANDIFATPRSQTGSAPFVPSDKVTAGIDEAIIRATQEEIDTLRETVPVAPLDKHVTVGLSTFREGDWCYFRVTVTPRVDAPLPVIPKDVVLLQDTSGSISAMRIKFCKRALTDMLATLNPSDRFNVVSFTDTFDYCFDQWEPINIDRAEMAARYIDTLHAFGRTDVFATLSSVMTLPRDPKRPMIALVVTDGEATSGLTASRKILTAFEDLNKGMISVYMFGVKRDANVGLMNLLASANRGACLIHTGERWEITPRLATFCRKFENPILSDITVTFDQAARNDVFPRRAPNLYRGETMTFVGRCPATAKQVRFYVRGIARDKGYASLFTLTMADTPATRGTVAVRTQWAEAKMLELIAADARNSTPESQAAIESLARTYGIAVDAF